MIYLIDNRNQFDPHINLALEEYSLRRLAADRSYLLLYVNRPSVIVGRHQNILAEVDLSFASQRGLYLSRRISGGGAVFHDFGNLNFCFIRHFGRYSLEDVRHVAEPVRSALLKIGVPAEFSRKNDLFVDGKKISGLAQFSDTKRIIFHGTLLINSDLDTLRRALQTSTGGIVSRARKSIPSEVTNISEYLPAGIGLRELRQHLVDCITAREGGLQEISLADRDWRAIHRLCRQKYRTWEWNYGRAPAFSIRRRVDTPFGCVETSIDVKNGLITAIRFHGHLARLKSRALITKRLIGVPYRRQDIVDRLAGIDSGAAADLPSLNQIAEQLCAGDTVIGKSVLQTGQGALS